MPPFLVWMGPTTASVRRADLYVYINPHGVNKCQIGGLAKVKACKLGDDVLVQSRSSQIINQTLIKMGHLLRVSFGHLREVNKKHSLAKLAGDTNV